MRILVASAYELGHQPLLAGTAAAVLRQAGHDVRVVDLSLSAGDGCAGEAGPGDAGGWDEAAGWADAAAFAVPMHTAARLAVEAAGDLGRRRPGLPMAAFGLYAGVLGADPVAGERFGWTIAGEYEEDLARWAATLDRPTGGGDAGAAVRLTPTRRAPTSPPARELLAPLDRYARLAVGEERRLAGYVEASRGCVHHCTHCPIPPVYGGRLRIVDLDSVVADVDRQVEAGATHITFGDPDFLNGPRHSMRVVEEIHRRHPDLTFDITAKVEHVLRYEEVWPVLARSGLLFVVTAVECLDDDLLRRLAKNHTAAEAALAVALLLRHGVEARPSF
ncbi:MAG TPA: radical SAM protein, partial [Acidimicrobiales bacterium]|nr:radical SAM protein [Acidimicrobiales bacterium]